MKTHDWRKVCERALRQFGGAPSGQLEQDLIDAFRVDPEYVIAQFEAVAQRHKDGYVENPWALWRARVMQRPENVVVAASGGGMHADQAKKVRAAENWIRNAGLYFDREDQVEDELFNSTIGMLRAYAADEGIRARMLELWRRDGERGEKAEAESLAYQAKLRADLANMRNVTSHTNRLTKERGDVSLPPEPEPVRPEAGMQA